MNSARELRRGEERWLQCAERPRVGLLQRNDFSESDEMLVAADGRNSTVARLCQLLPGKDAIAWPCKHTCRYHPISAIASFSNFCPKDIPVRRRSGMGNSIFVWSAGREISQPCAIGRRRNSPFRLTSWRTITPLARAPLPRGSAGIYSGRRRCPRGGAIYRRRNLLCAGSGELAAEAIVARRPDELRRGARNFMRAGSGSTRSPRVAVEHPRFTSGWLRVLPNERQILRLLTTKVVRP